ncbi:MAG: hypothetical protein IKI30_07645 [Oxalobacter sp.]|nr:hypothetical protein [Oxalobacter sp.]
MKKLDSKNFEDKLQRCFPRDRFYTAPVCARRSVDMQLEPRVIATEFLAYAYARKKNELNKIEKLSLEIILDEYAEEYPVFGYIRKAYWLREAISKQELGKPTLSYLEINENATDEEIGLSACLEFFRGDSYFCQGTNYIPNLGDIVSDWRDGDAPVLLLMPEMGFLPYQLAMNGINSVVRCPYLPDVELAGLLSPLVEGRIQFELTKKEDIYKAYTGPISSVICLATPQLMLRNTNKRAKRQRLGVLEKLHRWHSGKVVLCTMQDRLLDKQEEAEELKIREKMVKSGWVRKIVQIPAKIPSDGYRQPVMLYVDFAAQRFTGVQMVNLSDDRFTEKDGPYRWLKIEVVKPLLFTHKGSGDPSNVDFSRLLERPIALEMTDALSGVSEYADYTCICSLDEMRENGFSLDVLRYLIGSRNRMWFQLASESRVVLPDIDDLIAFQDLPLASADEDGIDCLMVEPEDLEVDGGVRQPTRQVRVTREGFAQCRVQRNDILLARHGSKEQLGKIALLVEKCPDNWVASPSLMIIRQKKTERVGDWQEKPWYWSQEQVYRYLTSDAVTAYLKSKMWNPHASAFPTRYLESLPMVMADNYAVAAEIFRFRQRMEILLENRKNSTPNPYMTKNQVKRLI